MYKSEELDLGWYLKMFADLIIFRDRWIYCDLREWLKIISFFLQLRTLCAKSVRIFEVVSNVSNFFFIFSVVLKSKVSFNCQSIYTYVKFLIFFKQEAKEV